MPALISGHLDSGADLTIGSRFIRASTKRTVPSSKIDANSFATALTNLVVGFAMSDVASGMRVLGRRATHLALRANDYGIAVELLAAAHRRGLKITEVPIAVRYDAGRPYCTSQCELLNLLDLVIRTAEPHWAGLAGVVRLRRCVARYDRTIVRMPTALFYLHPVREYRGYLFQRQPEWFVALDALPPSVITIGCS